jgi:hypothetical protein
VDPQFDSQMFTRSDGSTNGWHRFAGLQPGKFFDAAAHDPLDACDVDDRQTFTGRVYANFSRAQQAAPTIDYDGSAGCVGQKSGQV